MLHISESVHSSAVVLRQQDLSAEDMIMSLDGKMKYPIMRSPDADP